MVSIRKTAVVVSCTRLPPVRKTELEENMALVTEPEPVTDHHRICDRRGADKWDQGITSIVKNYSATRFSIVVEMRKGGFKASINYLGKCDPGSNESLYLAPGFYKTGLMSISGGFYPHSRGNREIVMIVSDDISKQSCRAEKEHCMDGVQAFEITLKSADDTIKRVKQMLEADNRRHVTYFSKKAAVRAVKRKLVSQAAHPRIGQIFSDAIASDGTVTASFKTGMEKLYFDTALLTQKRDTEKWHSFRFDTHEYRPYFASCRGYQLDRYEYRKMLMPALIAEGGVSPSSASLIRL